MTKVFIVVMASMDAPYADGNVVKCFHQREEAQKWLLQNHPNDNWWGIIEKEVE